MVKVQAKTASLLVQVNFFETLLVRALKLC